MNSDPQLVQDRADRLNTLTATGADTLMGQLLRKFWQPIGLSKDFAPGKAKRVRVLGEDLTLYRGIGGAAHLVGGRCAHRLTWLHTGWVEGDQIRCMYHGWKYGADGRCIERPAEGPDVPPNIKVAGYPVHEYCGIIFGYLGEGKTPAFELGRKDVFEKPGMLLFSKLQLWPCNWFQMVENVMDNVHVSFTHRMGRIGTFGELVSDAIPRLEYYETEAGLRQVGTRGQGNVRVVDWTFPNNNHITQPFLRLDDQWIDVATWQVPCDDFSTVRYMIYATPSTGSENDERFLDYCKAHADYSPTDHHDELFDGKYPDDVFMDLTHAQDYVVQVGQGAIADRAHETLGKSDAGIALLRRVFLRELELIREGKPTKQWRKLDRAADMPIIAESTAS